MPCHVHAHPIHDAAPTPQAKASRGPSREAGEAEAGNRTHTRSGRPEPPILMVKTYLSRVCESYSHSSGGLGLLAFLAGLPLPQTCKALGEQDCWLELAEPPPLPGFEGERLLASRSRGTSLVATYLWRAKAQMWRQREERHVDYRRGTGHSALLSPAIRSLSRVTVLEGPRHPRAQTNPQWKPTLIMDLGASPKA